MSQLFASGGQSIGVSASTQDSQIKKKKKSENNIKDILGYLNHDNIHIMGILKGEEREKGTEKAFEEIMAENLPNLKKETEI